MNTESFIYICIGIAGILLFYFFIAKTETKNRSLTKREKKGSNITAIKNPPPKDIVMKEIFDYGNIKIMNDNGIYTVNNNGVIMTYKSWRYLPLQFQKMVKQVDSGTLAKSKFGYFIDNINGVYYLTMPNGKKKKYNNLDEVPQNIRKLL